MASLRVDGEVAAPRRFGFDELQALAGQVDDIGAIIPQREGGGVLLQSILDAVSPSPRATHVTLSSADGSFSASVPVDAVRDAIVVYRLGDGQLPPSKGGPLRFYIPDVEQCAIGGVDACANVKFLGHIRLTIGPSDDTRPTTSQTHADLHKRQ